MSNNFPSGTVPFLFTDIEGSTKLWEQHPQQMLVADARHNQILREAIESNQGYVFQIIGDAFCAAFHSAGDAIHAALKCQMDLQSEKWDCTPSTNGHSYRKGRYPRRRRILFWLHDA